MKRLSRRLFAVLLATSAELARAIREGVDRSGQPYRAPMAYGSYRNISDADISAIIAYLRASKPQPMGAKN